MRSASAFSSKFRSKLLDHRPRIRLHGQAAARLCCVVGMLALALPAPVEAETVKDVLRAVENGDYAWARAKATDAGGTLLREYVVWRELRDGTPLPSFERFQAHLEEPLAWPDGRRIQARAEEALDSSKDNETVLAFFAEREPLTRQGRTRLAMALLDEGQRDQAQNLARKAWIEGRFSSSEEEFFLGRLGDLIGPDDHRERLDAVLAAGQWAEARRQAKRVDAGHRKLAEARILLQSGAKGIDRAVAAVPDALKADPGLTLDRITRARKDGRDVRARELLLLTRSAADQPSAWWKERQIQIRDRLDARAFKEAYRLATAHRQPATDSSFADAEWLAGWIALSFLDRPKDAAKHFEAIAGTVSSPISLARGGYWAGRARAEAGQTDAAAVRWQEASQHGTTFYGQLAWLEGGHRPSLPPLDFPAAGKALRETFDKDKLVRLARLLCEHGGNDQAGSLLAFLADRSLGQSSTLGLVAELAADCKRMDTVVQTARLAQRTGRLNAAAAFPAPPFASLTKSLGVDPALVTAVARQESQFYARAQSPAGALGLLQLMPGTAKAMARRQGVDYAKSRLLTDPVYNVSLGRTYLEEQLNKWGEPAMAIAAYNAGPQRVSTWIDRYGDPRGKGLHELIDWIEIIPFTETRNYVQRVLEGRNVYRVRFGWDAEVAGHPFEPRVINPS
ncbi:MAG TPA: lytic transglycosylase domain-containing protein [Geminicoccus sp.]|jgi:soluble lytic murein transglycosylase|uniref:lytic transglycosylase domain-containing protein n=1 Tax=Geminicoccus sp. TaxID=2024832 RepID=UPI002E34498A|nr:lytic transglycosylase domain-containing protein [Geminicoccus sp.]HEX2525762.1 lytic transglycosylase domain-containing protein [Geminicoccus sp.]